jgi:hypothetical protein
MVVLVYVLFALMLNTRINIKVVSLPGLLSLACIFACCSIEL